YFTAALVVFVLALTLAGLALVALAGRLRGRVGVAWRFGVANLSRRRAESVVQLVAFGTGIMALLLLSILRDDLNGDWQRTLPPNLPNYFFINIPPAVREDFVRFLAAQGARTTRVLPMIRGRLTAINARPVEALRPGHGGEEGFATREQNLTWTSELGPDNRIIAGRWWTAEDFGKPLVSLATEFQEALGVEVGDRLTFDIAGEPLEARVASIRKVKWDTFQPNFFIVFAPGVLESAAGTYLTSAYFAPGAARSLAQLARRFPSVSIFDIDELLAQVRSVLDKAALAVERRRVLPHHALAGAALCPGAHALGRGGRGRGAAGGGRGMARHAQRRQSAAAHDATGLARSRPSGAPRTSRGIPSAIPRTG